MRDVFILSLVQDIYNFKQASALRVLHQINPYNINIQQVWSDYTKHLEEEINQTLEDNLDHKLQPLYNLHRELEIGDKFIEHYISWVTKKQIENTVR